MVGGTDRGLMKQSMVNTVSREDANHINHKHSQIEHTLDFK